MMQENKKTSFIKNVWYSIKDFEKYEEFATNKVANSMKYILGLALIFVFVMSLAITFKFSNILNKGISYFNENIQEIVYKDGKLTINSENPITIENIEGLDLKIIIDTKEIEENKIEEYKKQVNDEQNVVILLKNEVIVKSEMLNTLIESSYNQIFGKYDIQKFDRDMILNYLSGSNLIKLYISMFVLMYIYLFILHFATILMDVLMFSILAYITSRIFGMKIRFSASFNIVVHALTLPILLNIIYVIINTIIGFNIKYFQIMYIAITYIYIISAILTIRSNLIKRNMELNLILEEEQKLRNELKNKEKEQEEKKETKNNEEDDDEREEKQGTKSGNHRKRTRR